MRRKLFNHAEPDIQTKSLNQLSLEAYALESKLEHIRDHKQAIREARYNVNLLKKLSTSKDTGPASSIAIEAICSNLGVKSVSTEGLADFVKKILLNLGPKNKETQKEFSYGEELADQLEDLKQKVDTLDTSLTPSKTTLTFHEVGVALGIGKIDENEVLKLVERTKLLSTIGLEYTKQLNILYKASKKEDFDEDDPSIAKFGAALKNLANKYPGPYWNQSYLEYRDNFSDISTDYDDDSDGYSCIFGRISFSDIII